MPSAEFEPAIPAIDRRQSYTLDLTATGFGLDDIYSGLQIALHSWSSPTKNLHLFYISLLNAILNSRILNLAYMFLDAISKACFL